MKQHASLSAERWAEFTLEQQLLNVASEMQRAAGRLAIGDREAVVNSYERVLRLVDLTVEANPRRNLRRELLRWRDVVAGLCLSPSPDPAAHAAALRALLQLNPTTARQIPFLLP